MVCLFVYESLDDQSGFKYRVSHRLTSPRTVMIPTVRPGYAVGWAGGWLPVQERLGVHTPALKEETIANFSPTLPFTATRTRFRHLDFLEKVQPGVYGFPRDFSSIVAHFELRSVQFCCFSVTLFSFLAFCCCSEERLFCGLGRGAGAFKAERLLSLVPHVVQSRSLMVAHATVFGFSNVADRTKRFSPTSPALFE